jgi:hypothetical protein
MGDECDIAPRRIGLARSPADASGPVRRPRVSTNSSSSSQSYLTCASSWAAPLMSYAYPLSLSLSLSLSFVFWAAPLYEPSGCALLVP